MGSQPPHSNIKRRSFTTSARASIRLRGVHACINIEEPRARLLTGRNMSDSVRLDGNVSLLVPGHDGSV